MTKEEFDKIITEKAKEYIDDTVIYPEKEVIEEVLEDFLEGANVAFEILQSDRLFNNLTNIKN